MYYYDRINPTVILANMKKVNFIIDPNKEYKYHKLFEKIPQFNTMSLFAFVPIKDKKRIIRKINNFWDNKDKKLITGIEKKWREIEKGYFDLVSKITEEDWLYNEYNAYILAFSTIIGFSNPFNLKSKEIALTISSIINPKFLVAHELFHSHYYYVIEKYGMTNKANKTLFTEGVAALVLTETKMKSLFPETNFESSISSYPQVRTNWNRFKELWNKRKSFKGFIIEAVKKTKAE